MDKAQNILIKFLENEITTSGKEINFELEHDKTENNADYFTLHTQRFFKQTTFKVIGEDVFVLFANNFYKVSSNNSSIRYFWIAVL